MLTCSLPQRPLGVEVGKAFSGENTQNMKTPYKWKYPSTRYLVLRIPSKELPVKIFSSDYL